MEPLGTREVILAPASCVKLLPTSMLGGAAEKLGFVSLKARLCELRKVTSASARNRNPLLLLSVASCGIVTAPPKVTSPLANSSKPDSRPVR